MIKNIFIFAGGALTGSSITYILTKRHLEKRMQQDLNSVREMYITQAEPKEKFEDACGVIVDTITTLTNYSELTSVYSEPEEDNEEFYFIQPEVFTELNGNEKVELTLFADGVLTNDSYAIVDPKETCGSEAIDILMADEADELYVYNSTIGIEYAIVKNESSYNDATGIIKYGDDY